MLGVASLTAQQIAAQQAAQMAAQQAAQQAATQAATQAAQQGAQQAATQQVTQQAAQQAGQNAAQQAAVQSQSAQSNLLAQSNSGLTSLESGQASALQATQPTNMIAVNGDAATLANGQTVPFVNADATAVQSSLNTQAAATQTNFTTQSVAYQSGTLPGTNIPVTSQGTLVTMSDGQQFVVAGNVQTQAAIDAAARQAMAKQLMIAMAPSLLSNLTGG